MSVPPAARATATAVQITGMGIVSAIGQDIPSFAAALKTGQSGISRSQRHTTPPLAVDIAAEITAFDFAQSIRSIPGLPTALIQTALHVTRRAPLALQTSVAAALQAWCQAGLSETVEPERIGLVVAGHNTTQHDQYALHDAFVAQPEYLSPRYALQFMDSNQIGVISEILNIRGEGLTCGGASASGNVGIIQAQRLIQAGVVDACLVIGVMANLSPMEIQAFHAIGAMGGKVFHDRPQQACRPFDTQHEGFIYGQASACLVLESAASAGRRNAPVLARVAGGAIRLHACASSEPSRPGEADVMRAALQQSGLEPGDIDYLNTHGSSSPLGDSVELDAISDVFGAHFPQLWLNATKGLSGHCLYSAGVVEAIASVIQIQQGFLHPNLNLDTPIRPDARFSSSVAEHVGIATTMSNSFGFGGINTSIVLQKI